MAKSVANEIQSLIKQLQSQRAEHVAKIAEIDGVFAELGMDAPATAAPKTRGRKPGRPAGSKNKSKAKTKKTGKRRRRGPGTYSQTAKEFVLELVNGKKLTTGEVNAAWKEASRGGSADNTLMDLSKKGLIKKEAIKGKRGSTYAGK